MPIVVGELCCFEKHLCKRKVAIYELNHVEKLSRENIEVSSVDRAYLLGENDSMTIGLDQHNTNCTVQMFRP